ncbi:MAG: caspase family protein [Bradymonadales bacterium]|nr:caspase family protein [Bradymonadales bacterium]
MRTHLFALFFLLTLLSTSVALAQPSAGVRRLALVVGANDGGPERVTLRYAGADAHSFAVVMAEMGGLAETDSLLLLDPDRAGLQDAFAVIAGRLREVEAEHSRVEFFFYYSGHSDEVGLLLSDGPFEYEQIRTLVNGLSADIRIGVFDSCASGAFTRLKGGEWQPAFLVDASTDIRGHAYMTSSSADEVAQESDAIGASFFTYYLVSGLRGAADFNGDRRVTLNEAYRFAFDETLASTESTRGGPQHPAYDIELVGTGDIVLTDLNETSAALVIGEDLQGRFFVRDAGGTLVAELYKPAGRRIELGLSPGTYDIRVDTEHGLFTACVVLTENGTNLLATDQLVELDREGTLSRGEPIAIHQEVETVEESDRDYRHLPLAVSLFTPIDSNSVEAERPVLNNFALNWIFGRADRLDGLQLAFGGQAVAERIRGLQVAGVFDLAGGQIQGLQVAGGFNQTDGSLQGLQVAGGFNLTEGTTQGLQVAGAFNYASMPLAGLQVSGAVNATGTSIAGVQLTGGLNYAGEVGGVQLATVNIAGEVDGLQLGVLNLATDTVDGLQFGLFNYAERASASIGLIGGTRAGGFHPQLWTSDSAVISTGLRSDADYTYTLLTAGVYPFSEETAWLFGAGLGVKFPRFFPRLALEMDLSHHAVMFEHDFSQGYLGLSVARLLARWEITPAFSLFAGPALNLYVGQGANRLRERPGYIGGVVTYEADEDLRLELWPGFAAGISLL